MIFAVATCVVIVWLVVMIHRLQAPTDHHRLRILDGALTFG